MGDSLEARISIVEHIQEEFGHDIQEMKGQLAKLTKLIEGYTGAVSENICGSPSFPQQTTLPPFIHQQHLGHGSRIPIRGNVPSSVHHLHPSCEPHISVRGNVSPRVHHPNWQPHAPIPAIIPTFGKASQLVDPVNSLGNNFEKPKRNRDKKWLEPIPVTYTELLPRLLERQLVELLCVLPLKPPFPKSYNPNVHCDYHSGIQGHSTEDCISLKKKVRTLIEAGKINFKGPNQSTNLLLNFSRAKTEEVRQDIPSTENEEFATTSEGISGRKTGYTSEKIEEEKKASELQKENEKLRRLVQDMAYMMTEQKESIATLRGGM